MWNSGMSKIDNMPYKTNKFAGITEQELKPSCNNIYMFCITRVYKTKTPTLLLFIVYGQH